MQDNQILTADDLNNIAIDLGATTFSNFKDSKSYAITEINNITKDLVTKGILRTASDCKCTISEDNAVTVGSGVAVFSDGCKFRLEDPLTVQLSNADLTYIFFEHNNELDSVSLVADTKMSEKDCVLLATVENGIITDKRSYAVAKVNLNAEGTSYMVSLKAKGGQLYNPETFSVKLPITDNSKVFCSTFTDVQFSNNVAPWCGQISALYNVAESEIFFPVRYSDGSNPNLCWHNKKTFPGNWANQSFSREDNTLTYSLETTFGHIEFNINIYVFDGINLN